MCRLVISYLYDIAVLRNAGESDLVVLRLYALYILVAFQQPFFQGQLIKHESFQFVKLNLI